jgi:hypothetical protein
MEFPCLPAGSYFSPKCIFSFISYLLRLKQPKVQEIIREKGIKEDDIIALLSLCKKTPKYCVTLIFDRWFLITTEMSQI